MTLNISQRKYTIKNILKKGEDSLIDLWEKSKNEANETKEAEKILRKYVTRKEVTEEENKILKDQTFDLIKIIFIGIPLAVIPGFSVIMVIIVKAGRRYKFNVLPSSFVSKNKE
jgi:hypothetical protein